MYLAKDVPISLFVDLAGDYNIKLANSDNDRNYFKAF